MSVPWYESVREAPRIAQEIRWRATVDRMRADPDYRESLVRSAESSMALSGFLISRDRIEAITEKVLNGPPLVLRD